MDSTRTLVSGPMTQPARKSVTRGMVVAQSILGAFAYLFFVVPYMRRVRGLDRLPLDRKYLFVANHVSLLDTILLGGLFWRRGCYPILVLGDKGVWHASPLHRALSSRIGFLLERGKLNLDRIHELETFGRSIEDFHLVVFPEGTRGDGLNVARCQPGIYHIAQESQAPIVPVYHRKHATNLQQDRPLSSLQRPAPDRSPFRRSH